MEDTSVATDFALTLPVESVSAASHSVDIVNRSYTGTQDCAHLLLQARVLRTPMDMAVRDGDLEIDYMQLNSRANQLARYLRDQGLRPGDPLGIVLNDTSDMAVMLLGGLKVGAYLMPLRSAIQWPAYLPTGATVVAVDEPEDIACISFERHWHLIAEQPGANLAVEVAPFQLACRNQSGRECRHDALARRVAEYIGAKGLVPGDTVEIDITMTMDTLLIRCFAAWLSGACLVIKPG